MDGGQCTGSLKLRERTDGKFTANGQQSPASSTLTMPACCTPGPPAIVTVIGRSVRRCSAWVCDQSGGFSSAAHSVRGTLVCMGDQEAIDALVSDLHWQIDQLK